MYGLMEKYTQIGRGKDKDLSLLIVEWNYKFFVTLAFDMLSNAKFIIISLWCFKFTKEEPLVYFLLLR